MERNLNKPSLWDEKPTVIFFFFFLVQEHLVRGKQCGGCAGVRWGMAQLPPHVPVGLPRSRVGQLPDEPEQGVHRRVRPVRTGVRPEDSWPASGGQTVPVDGRRFAGLWPRATRTCHYATIAEDNERANGRGRI